MMKYSPAVFLTLVLCTLSPAHGQESSPLVLSPLILSQTVSLPNVQGGFNHMSVDAEHLRLFAAAPTNKTLEIVDLKAGKPWRSLEGEKPAAVRYAPEFNQLYVSRGQSVSIYDGKTFDLITSIDLESNLDELQYDARAKRLYVGCMTPGKTGIAVIAIPDGKLLGKISLPDKLQGIAVEQNGIRIFANMPTLKQVAVMDRYKLTLLTTWPLANAEGNTPLGLDEARHRLFVGTRHPAQLVVLDTATGKAVAKINTNSDADDLFYDPAHKRIYVSCGEGFIDVIEHRDADHYRLIARVPTVAGARTSAFSAELSSFYLGVPRRGDQPAELRIFKVGN
jgi:DNA-binding beta-propeller fold protein YncE